MKIEISMEQLQVIGQCLENAPYKLVASVMVHLQQQIDAARTTEPQENMIKDNGAGATSYK
jgi:hypothetical protein